MSTNETGGGQDALAVEKVGERREARVGQVHDADVGLNGREGVIRRKNRVAGQRVEECRLADIGKTDDRDSESHDAQGYPVLSRATLREFVAPALPMKATRVPNPPRGAPVK